MGSRHSIFSSSLVLVFFSAICFAQPGIISTYAGNGSGTYSGDGGPALKAGIPAAAGLAMDAAGNLYILETGIARVRKVSAAGIVSAVAGTGTSGFGGDGGQATSAQLFPGHGIAVDGSGNVYIADSFNQRIRKVDPSGIITTVAGNGTIINGIGQGTYGGDGGPATSALLNFPDSVAVDSAGNLYIADTSNYRIRRVDKNTGIITTVVGNGNVPQNKSSAGDGGIATQTAIQQPNSVAVDNAGNIFFSSIGRVQKVDSGGIIRTVAGDGTQGDTGDGGPGISAEVKSISSVGADNAGGVYITESTDRVRHVDSSGIIKTVAGNGTRGCTGEGGPAISAQITNPQGVVVDSAGNFYISACNIQKINALVTSTAPVISLVSNAFQGSQTLAPNTWVQVKGVNLAPDTRIWGGSDFVNNQMPIALDGVSVAVNGKPAFIYYISPTQVNILTPPDAISGTVSVQLTSGGVKSNVVNSPAAPLSEAFFTFDGTHVTATHADGSLIGPATLYPGLSTPAKPGETIIVYATGFGLTTVPIVSGALTQSGTLNADTPIVAIGAFVASVPFAGLVAPGQFQFNIVVPASAPDGDLQISASYNNAFTPKTATLAVQH